MPRHFTVGELMQMFDNWPESMPVVFNMIDGDLELLSVYDSEDGATLYVDMDYAEELDAEEVDNDECP